MWATPPFLACVFALFISFAGALKIDLNGQWKLQSKDNKYNVAAKVPGSVYTALMDSRIIGDPYYRFNDVTYAWIAKTDWIYSRTFLATDEMVSSHQVELHCEGLDTVASVYINGILVGSSYDMFSAHVFHIEKHVKVGLNDITVVFESPVLYAANQSAAYPYRVPPACPPEVIHGTCHMNFIRKEQRSFGWDWGPSFPTMGIWRNISIEVNNSTFIKYIQATTSKQEMPFEQWYVNFTVHFDVSEGMQKVVGVLKLDLPGLHTEDTINAEIDGQHASVNVFMPVKNVKPEVWWPNGYGKQPLYRVIATLMDQKHNVLCSESVRIGFREVELVQEPIKGSVGLSFYFKINGQPIYMKGSNWIPADSFQERITEDKIRNLLQSAKDANMNMLRVWGGGIYESDIFYRTADDMGIMLWQDFMFACALYPVDEPFLKAVRQEVVHQVRRLHHHPSIVVWSGNNENEGALANDWYNTTSRFSQYKRDYIKLYIDTVREIVSAEDTGRPFLSSSPTNGQETIQEGWIAKNPMDPRYGDVHPYNYSAGSWNWASYITPRFASEYGFQSWPSFEALKNVSVLEDWSIDSGWLSHRQHHQDGNKQMLAEISPYLNLPTTKDPVQQLKDYIYLSQINQAMSVKTETEHYRRGRGVVSKNGGKTMGALYWQLNDIWQGPTWSSIDGTDLTVALVVDLPWPSNPKDGNHRKITDTDINFKVQVYSWDSFDCLNYDHVFLLEVLKNVTIVYQRPLADILDETGCTNRSQCFLRFEINGTSSWLLLTSPKDAMLQKAEIKILSVEKIGASSFSIHLSSSSIALFVWLEADGIPGRFSDNGFLMVTKDIKLYFFSWDDNITQEALIKSLQVRTLTDVQ